MNFLHVLLVFFVIATISYLRYRLSFEEQESDS